MATQLKIRRGSTAQTAVFTGASAEITVDTSKNTVVVHDGLTAGGHPLALQVTTQADIASFSVTNNTIASSSDTINFLPSGVNPTIYQGKILVNNNLTISSNVIQTTVSGSDLNINTTGTGQVVVNSNMLVNGDLHATGSITADGNITLGNQSTDTVTFDAEIASSILPATNNLYNLGSDPTASGQAWANAYIHDIHSTNITAPAAVINGRLELYSTGVAVTVGGTSAADLANAQRLLRC